MRTHSRRRAQALAIVVLTAAVGYCGHVEAQQTGLFPRAPIRRQRVPCDQEDPTYKIYKQQYFGYHPTCWRTFPPGWGCPSAEAPNKERSFQELKPGQMSEEETGEMNPPEDRGAPPERRPPRGLELPPERDPFAPDTPAGGAPNVTPLPRGNARPGTPPPPRRDDPFRDIDQGGVTPPSRSRTGARNAPATSAEGTPELSAPAGQPAQGSASRSEPEEEEGEILASGDQGPLLGLSDSDIARSDGANSSSDAQPAAASDSATGSSSVVGAATPARGAQPRRRIFGNLFSSLGTNWLRR
jgi:hypothetical protein